MPARDIELERMYYEVSGKGNPLIVLHGAYMNIPSMGAIIPKLARTHRVYALELQGHGRTTDIDRPITYQNLADDVAAFRDAVGLQKADVFGYSMGAVAGLQLAIRHPEKVNKLVFASGGYDAEGWQPEFKAFIPPMTAFLLFPHFPKIPPLGRAGWCVGIADGARFELATRFPVHTLSRRPQGILKSDKKSVNH
jgi:pimeloyl-ACP methyl ester carboxylesterase